MHKCNSWNLKKSFPICFQTKYDRKQLINSGKTAVKQHKVIEIKHLYLSLIGILKRKKNQRLSKKSYKVSAARRNKTIPISECKNIYAKRKISEQQKRSLCANKQIFFH